MNPGSPVPEPTLIITSLTDVSGPPILLKGFSFLSFSPLSLPVLDRKPARHGSGLARPPEYSGKGILGAEFKGRAWRSQALVEASTRNLVSSMTLLQALALASKTGARIPGELMTTGEQGCRTDTRSKRPGHRQEDQADHLGMQVEAPP